MAENIFKYEILTPTGRSAVSYQVSNYFECYNITTYWKIKVGTISQLGIPHQ